MPTTLDDFCRNWETTVRSLRSSLLVPDGDADGSFLPEKDRENLQADGYEVGFECTRPQAAELHAYISPRFRVRPVEWTSPGDSTPGQWSVESFGYNIGDAGMFNFRLRLERWNGL
jgi:hypothetical protein